MNKAVLAGVYSNTSSTNVATYSVNYKRCKPDNFEPYCSKPGAAVCYHKSFMMWSSISLSILLVWAILRIIRRLNLLHLLQIRGRRLEPASLELAGLACCCTASITTFVEDYMLVTHCSKEWDPISGTAPLFEVLGCCLYAAVVYREEFQEKEDHWFWHVFPFVVMLTSSVLEICADEKKDARRECGHRMTLMADIFDGFGLALFVVGGLVDRYWKPKAVPILKWRLSRWLCGIPRKADPKAESLLMAQCISEDDAHVEAWKICVECRIDYVGVSCLLVSTVMPLFFGLCTTSSASDAYDVWISLVACLCFLVFSAYEKREADEEMDHRLSDLDSGVVLMHNGVVDIDDELKSYCPPPVATARATQPRQSAAPLDET